MEALRLAWKFLRIGILNEFQYRANFFVQLLQSLVALGTGLFALAIVFDHTTELAGWSVNELLAVMGVHILMGGLIQSYIQPNMQRLIEDIREGTLDFALTKPVDAQLIVSIREVRLWSAVDILLGLIVVVVAILRLRQGVGPIETLSFIIVLVAGAMMIYSFWLVLTTIAFRVVRVGQIVELFQGVYQAGRWPVGIYPGWLRASLTFLVPIAFAVTVPSEALTGRLETTSLAGAIALALFLVLFSRAIFRFGLRQYSGASA